MLSEITVEEMQSMKYIQLIFSPVGGTKKAADAVMRHLSSDAQTIDLTDAEADFSKCVIGKEDVVLIAMPSYGGRIPAIAAERLRRIHGNSAKCILVCVYGNRAYEDTLAEMEDTARESGFQIAAAISAVAQHSIMHQYAAGRPDAADLSQLEAFADRIKEKLDSAQASGTVQIPGNRPYKKAGCAVLIPKASRNCTGCGLCAGQCPVKAINPADLKSADSKKCISCMRCVTICPQHARKINEAMVSAVSLAVKKACSARKECERFL